MKQFLAVCSVLLLTAAAHANDSAIEGVGGSPTAIGSLRKIMPMKGEHPTIGMVNERVNITVGATTYDVVADFEFRNHGTARTVTMGFPEGAAGDMDFEKSAQKTAYQNFRTSVDGEKLGARRMVPVHDPDDLFEFDSYWVKSVPFARHQTRHVRVSYRAPLGETADSRYLSYDFTGGNWKGRVKDSVLSVRFAAPGHYTIWPIDKELKAWQTRKDDTLTFRWHNWQAQYGFNLRFKNELPGALTPASNRAELKEKATLEENQSTLIVNGDAKYDVWRTPLLRPTDYVLRDGHSFVAMSELADLVQREIANRQSATSKPLRYGFLKWNAPNRSAVLNLGDGRQLQFTDGSDQMRVYNRYYLQLPERNQQMPAPAFIGGRGGGQTLYVPLASAMEVLNGQVEVNAKTRRVWVDLENMK